MLTKSGDDVGPVAAERWAFDQARTQAQPEAEVAVGGGLRRLRQLSDDQRMTWVDGHHRSADT